METLQACSQIRPEDLKDPSNSVEAVSEPFRITGLPSLFLKLPTSTLLLEGCAKSCENGGKL